LAFRIKTLRVGKGKTTGDEKAGEWNKQYYEAEILVEDEHQIELAKESVETLLDTWLKGELINEPQPPSEESTKDYDMGNIKWTEAQGTSGPYQRSEDVNSLDHKALLQDLAAHKGKMRKNGFFIWTFKNGYTIGRKPVKGD
jgi:hypothetical protein